MEALGTFETGFKSVSRPKQSPFFHENLWKLEPQKAMNI